MEPKQAERLGKVLRRAREQLDLSTREVAERAGLPQSTIVRLEQGHFLAPRAEKLAAIAEALGLNPADVLALAKYPTLSVMPSPALYLRTKYRHLPDDQLDAIARDVTRTLKRHGIDAEEGPAPGEDERDDDSPRKRGDSRNQKAKKKGGMR